jgi:hypothetical protein
MDGDIDDILKELEPQTTDIVPIEDALPVEVIPKTEDDLINIALDKNENLEEQLNDVVDIFMEGLERGTDRSHSSKEQLIEALKTKLEINKMLIEMAKIKNKKAGDKIGVMISTVSPTQSGINITNIKSAMDEEE